MDPCNKPKHVNLHRCSTLLSHIVSFLSVQHFQGKDIQMFLVKVRAAMILVPLGTGRNILLSTRADIWGCRLNRLFMLFNFNLFDSFPQGQKNQSEIRLGPILDRSGVGLGSIQNRCGIYL